MEETERTRRTWVLTIQRFAEMAWARQGPTRYASAGMAPLVVALAVPGWWWLICAGFTLVSVSVDLRAHRFFQRLTANLDAYTATELKAIIRRQIVLLSAITTLYVLPYALLAGAPQPGPLLGLLFCAGASVVCASLHVMTRTMVLYTIPMIAIGLVANAAMLTSGWMGALAGLLAALTGVNAVVAARGGAASFGDLIAARLAAEQDAEHLEARVAERTAELEVAVNAARAASRAKSMFLANMSHELRTPLNAIIGYAEMIEEDLQCGDVGQSAADLGRVRAAAGHLLALITEVLDFSRIEAGKLELRPADHDLAPLLEQTLDAVRPTASKNRTGCRLAMGPGVGRVHADETRLRQCLLNLLSNAAKFTADGQILLEARSCRIGAEAGVAISVRDTGAGISAENLARLFKPFVQVDSTSTRAHDGAGLGLVITRRLARAMGGDVTAASKLGYGSTFTLYLPAARVEKCAA